MNSPDIIVVGGGIWGLATALHLRWKHCASVCLLERHSDFALETTINAAGQVGQIRSSPVVTRAIAYALGLFESFPEQFGIDAGLVRCGSLFIGLSDERLAYFARQIALGRANGLRIDEVPPAQTRDFIPGLASSEILGSYFVHGDGYIDSLRAARALAHAAHHQGADLRRGVEVIRIRVEKGRVLGVDTNLGPMDASRVIITAGPWSASILRSLGSSLPVQAIRHQRIRTTRYASLLPSHPVLRVPDLSSYVRPEEGGLTFGHFEASPTPVPESKLPETRSMDLPPPLSLMHEAKKRLEQIYPDLASLGVRECCRAMITMAPDGAYAIGPVPGVEGLFVASGCAALGIAGSAAVGRWLAEWAMNGTTSEDLSEFSLTRFSEDELSPPLLERSACRAYAQYYAVKTESGSNPAKATA